MIERIHWLGHASFLIDGPPYIYIDPWRVIKMDIHADIILISHDHYDHCSVADIDKLKDESTTIIGNERVAEQIEKAVVLRPWQSYTHNRLNIKAIPAYSEKGLLHPRDQGGLGYIISINYYDIYYAGDTCIIPEMERVHPDIAILPIDNNDTLSVEEAVEAVDILRPRWVIPCNWSGAGKGASAVDAAEFKALVGGKAQVIVPELYRPPDSEQQS